MYVSYEQLNSNTFVTTDDKGNKEIFYSSKNLDEDDIFSFLHDSNQYEYKVNKIPELYERKLELLKEIKMVEKEIKDTKNILPQTNKIYKRVVKELDIRKVGKSRVLKRYK